MTARTASETRLSEADWVDRASAYTRRADDVLAPHQRRRRAGQAHPVYDFLFTYYNVRPGRLRVWHPGYGVVLEGPAADRYLERSGYARVGGGVAVGRDHLNSRLGTVTFIADLLRATASRPARFNCFGMHEWAMVYRASSVRHDRVPLRLGAAGTDAVVESMPLRCSHFDAYRFFTEPAVERNAARLTRDTQLAAEQPGCVHAGMDLYKWALKLGPLVDSGLVLDCLQLALDARVLDMRASPYDLRAYDFEPIAVETPSGRAEYVRMQEVIAERAAPLRSRLLEHALMLQQSATRA
ncbi:3-methyladenine DNA glycosylase [Mycobacterium sp. ITM-2016-00317]|uniref:3-methyladenine DNA glycosylase n=1 Tax=Mycobacterium sp. ITM-2016-00317 TaxID=2099694 RepID=UPI00287F8FB7|nr:3-methyladenine DNA glycosylase [Mycobacterium sp. ITM-2016-00317]WNG85180.1 3-methyladenine DNA glycosylase [Mycobacterium sp. ITM-2016-00317]